MNIDDLNASMIKSFETVAVSIKNKIKGMDQVDGKMSFIILFHRTSLTLFLVIQYFL